MAYNMAKAEIIEHLKEDAAYFPFEQIRSFKLLEKQPIKIEDSVKKDYLTFFQDVKKECEHLIQTERNHPDLDLWQEAIKEINEILK